jgi:cell pole-organizing protein PopZ
MTADTAQREPTMEEILASIRRIISEEDQPDTGSASVLDLAEPFRGSDDVDEPAFAEEDEFDMEAAMRDIAEEEPPVVKAPEDLMILEKEPEIAPPPAPAPKPKVEARPVFSNLEDSIVEEVTAQQAAGSLHRLMGSMTVSSENTLDGIVRSLLKPMLKEWLDANLPQIVESVVQKEVERIRRMAR